MRRKFRLNQLLKYRESIEDQQRNVLAAIKEKQYKEEEKLFHLRETQRSYQKQLNSEQEATSLQVSRLEALSQESLSRRRNLQKLQIEMLKAKEELLEASRNRKMMEKLRDRELEKSKRNLLDQERKNLDEVAAVRHIRIESMSSGTLRNKG